MMGVDQNISWGNAVNIQPTSLEPKDKGLVLIGKTHLAYYIREGDTLYIYEANWIPGKVTQRQLNIKDPSIRGYL